MPPSLKDVRAQACQLSQEDRLALAADLLTNLDAELASDPEVEQAWADEVRARIQHDLRHGLPSVIHEDLMASLRQR